MRAAVLALALSGCAAHVTTEAESETAAGDPRVAECMDAHQRLGEVQCGVPPFEAWLSTCLGWPGGLDTACIIEADDCIAANRCAQHAAP